MEKICHTDNMMVPLNKTCFELFFLIETLYNHIQASYTDGYEGLQGSSIKFIE